VVSIGKINRIKKPAIIGRISRIPFFISLLSVLFVLFEIGFKNPSTKSDFTQILYLCTLFTCIVSTIGRYFFYESRPRLKVLPLEVLLIVFLSLLLFKYLKLISSENLLFLNHSFWIYIAVFLVFIREFSALKIDVNRTVINPAQLFIVSFLVIIVTGGFLLMLPNATHTKISFIDAMFTSTSAVCVTGLIVVDTGSFFTEFGQIIILTLIQVGGIGIMTFASYFSYFFRGVSSYENQLALREITNTEKLGEVFSILKKIILITFVIEGFGALFIFQSIDINLFPDLTDRIFFSVFHAVSGFCNAGFSTLQNSLADGIFKFNYPLHLIIAGLIIIGGLGFPIVFNLLNFLKIKIKTLILNLFRIKHQIHTVWIININTRIVLITSLILIVTGTILFYIFEHNNTMAGHSFSGKIITAFFGSVTSRTAGFNTVDTGALKTPTFLVILFLMWVGASPGSTGGGIKTSTIAVAVLNIISIAKGKTRLEIFKREISTISINRAFAIIFLSIFAILISVFLISLFDSEKGLTDITFECVSAYSTVGLSRGITSDLSSSSKFVLILTMFAGRISLLTFLIAVFKKITSEKYRFPSENILIN
jgi:potassium uptake TrkH family protein